MDHADSTDLLIVAAPSRAASRRPDAGPAGDVARSFMAELARAMQTAAQRERKRIAKLVADEAAGQAEATRTRAAAEAHELERLAETDVERIQAWAAAEIARIRGEAERRTVERRSDLETYLARHQTIIGTEIDGLDSAVRDFDASLARFFDELGAMTDPADIVRRAGSLPAMPDLDAARSAARAVAIETIENPPPAAGDPSVAPADARAGVAVMDPEAIGRPDEGSERIARDPLDGVASVSPFAADPLDVQIGPEDETGNDAEQAAAGAAMPASAAARVLRSIIPWSPPNRSQDQGAPPH